jgi:hypothetical protein
MEMWPSAMGEMLMMCQKVLRKNDMKMCTAYAEFDGVGSPR